jgi:hypothetical protein
MDGGTADHAGSGYLPAARATTRPTNRYEYHVNHRRSSQRKHNG